MTDYYAALQEAWETSSAAEGALPDGVEGTSLFGLTTDEKIVAVNAWTVTSTIPTSFYVSGSQLANCINWAEFAELTPEEQSNVIALCNSQGSLLTGSANTASLAPGMFLTYFPDHSGPTITAMTNLAHAQVELWWDVSAADGGGGLTGPVSQADVTEAGLS